MKGKSFMTFSRRMVRANARRQALSGLPGEVDTADLEVRIEPFLAAGSPARPVTDLKPEEIAIRVDGIPVELESFGCRVAAVKTRDVVALLEAEPSSTVGLETRLAPGCLQAWETYRDLRSAERRQMAIDLVIGGPEAQSAQEAVRLKLMTLAGRVTGRADSSPWRMRFEPSWPAALAARELDLYNVMLAPPGRAGQGQVLVCEQRKGTAGSRREGLEVRLEGEGERVWGIVAVDAEIGQGWIRRLAFRVPSMKTRIVERRQP